MATILLNAQLLDLDPLRTESGCLRIENGRITDRQADLPTDALDEVIDCRDAVVMPGLVNGHTHLYSSLAVGMPPPARSPRNFREILELIWWRLDCALDGESVEMSARVGAIDALSCGTTTLIDHHASPNCIDGSLDWVERGLRDVGLRGVLCYETTDRHGPTGSLAGIEENRRYITRCQQRRDQHFAGLIGAHASFTLEDETLARLSDLANELDAGIHIHVAEDDVCDHEDARKRGFADVVQRLDEFGVLRDDSILAHCIHLSPEALKQLNERNLSVAHNPRSNMNNAVGWAPIQQLRLAPLLGTDGIGSDMFAEFKAAWFIARHQQAGRSLDDCLAMLQSSARRASRALDLAIGKLEVGAAADIVVTDYAPATPVDSANLLGHLCFGIGARYVRHVMIDGVWALRDRRVTTVDARSVLRESTSMARELWSRMVG